MRRAVSSGSAAALLVGIVVGAALVFATPAVLGDLATTITSVSTSTDTMTVTQPPLTITQTQINDITLVQPTTTLTITTTSTSTETITLTSEPNGGTATTTTQFGNYGVADLVQSCGAFGNPSSSVSCSLAKPVRSGDMLVVLVADVPGSQPAVLTTSTTTTVTGNLTNGGSGLNLSDSLGDSFLLVGMTSRPQTTYDYYIYAANLTSGGQDNFSLSGQGNYPFLLVHELQGLTRVAGFSSAQGTSASPSVASYVAPQGSFTLASVFVLNNRGSMDASVGAGPGYTFLDNIFGLSEECDTTGGALTSPFLMSAAIPWGELSVSFD